MHLNAWKTSQVKMRYNKFKNSLNAIARAACICRHSFAQFRTAIISVATGNLYGIADHTTPLYEDYARGALKHWEIVLRKVIKRALRLPTGYPNDLLHKVTGIPSIATLLNQKIVERLLRLYKGLENTSNPEECRLIQGNLLPPSQPNSPRHNSTFHVS